MNMNYDFAKRKIGDLIRMADWNFVYEVVTVEGPTAGKMRIIGDHKESGKIVQATDWLENGWMLVETKKEKEVHNFRRIVL